MSDVSTGGGAGVAVGAAVAAPVAGGGVFTAGVSLAPGQT